MIGLIREAYSRRDQTNFFNRMRWIGILGLTFRERGISRFKMDWRVPKISRVRKALPGTQESVESSTRTIGASWSLWGDSLDYRDRQLVHLSQQGSMLFTPTAIKKSEMNLSFRASIKACGLSRIEFSVTVTTFNLPFRLISESRFP